MFVSIQRRSSRRRLHHKQPASSPFATGSQQPPRRRTGIIQPRDLNSLKNTSKPTQLNYTIFKLTHQHVSAVSLIYYIYYVTLCGCGGVAARGQVHVNTYVKQLSK